MQMEIRALIEELKEALSHIYGKNLRGLYLYGSYARHAEDAESDVDVAIVLQDFADYWEEVQRTSHMISALSLKYDVSVSPVHVREADWLHGDSPFLHTVRKACLPL
jgi:predicted nucleotidyltransferase